MRSIFLHVILESTSLPIVPKQPNNYFTFRGSVSERKQLSDRLSGCTIPHTGFSVPVSPFHRPQCSKLNLDPLGGSFLGAGLQ